MTLHQAVFSLASRETHFREIALRRATGPPCHGFTHLYYTSPLPRAYNTLVGQMRVMEEIWTWGRVSPELGLSREMDQNVHVCVYAGRGGCVGQREGEILRDCHT